jgi:hypothetical protein
LSREVRSREHAEKSAPGFESLCLSIDLSLTYRRERPSSVEEEKREFQATIYECLSEADPPTLKDMASYLTEIFARKDAEAILEALWMSRRPTVVFFRSRRHKSPDPPYVGVLRLVHATIEQMLTLTSPPDAFKAFCINMDIAFEEEGLRVQMEEFGTGLDRAVESGLQWCEASDLVTLRDFLKLQLGQTDAAGRLNELGKQSCPRSELLNPHRTRRNEVAIVEIFTKALEKTEKTLG